MNESRKLAAILAADIAGYSRLMGQDDAGTVRELKAHQAVVLPMVGEFGGMIVDTAGDGILAHFPSAVRAAECAVAIQTTMAERNRDVPEDRRMLFRVGVHLGDIIYDGVRVYGDGVNIAARLESIAEPGAICLSEETYRQVRRKLAVPATDLGPTALKNIAEPVRVYALKIEAPAANGPSSRTGKLLFLFDNYALDCDRRELRRGADLVAVEPKVFDLLAYLVRNRDRVVSRDELIAAVWDGRIVSESALATCINAARSAIADSGEDQRLIKTLPRKGIRFVGDVRASDGKRSPAERAADAPLSLPDKPSIAVLPFQNTSDDPGQEYFADGMVEDIITGLSRIKWLFVIARNSSFVYKGKAVDVKRVGRELGVRYVLEGSVRRAGTRVRITVQLIEAETGMNLWAERYDGLLDDIFALQDEIAMNAVGAIEPNLRKVEIERVKRKRPESVDAYDLVLQALPFTYSHMAADAATAIPLLEKALELEPQYAAAHASLAWCGHFRFRSGLREEDREAAVRHARAAIAAGADDATALGMAGFVVALDAHELTTALKVFDHALTLSSCNIFALHSSALILSFLGKWESAIERAQRALRLSPFDALNYLSFNALAISYFCTGQAQEAHEAALSAVQLNPRFSICYLFLTFALVGLGRMDQARTAAQKVLALDPEFTIDRFSVTAAIEPSVFNTLAEAWGAAGLPEK